MTSFHISATTFTRQVTKQAIAPSSFINGSMCSINWQATYLGLGHDNGHTMGVKLGPACPAHHLEAGTSIVLLVALAAALIAPAPCALDDYQSCRQVYSHCQGGGCAQNLRWTGLGDCILLLHWYLGRCHNNHVMTTEFTMRP